MAKCPNCGKEVSEGVTFCPECGQRLKEGFTPEERQKYIEELNVSIEGRKRLRKEQDREKAARKMKKWEELTRKQKILGSVGLVIIIGIVVGLFSVLSGDGKTEVSKPSPADIGSTAILAVSESDMVLVAIDQEAFEELIKASVAKDYMGIAELLLLGKVFEVPNDTKVLVIESSFAKRKIRILEGDQFGWTGWVPYEFLE